MKGYAVDIAALKTIDETTHQPVDKDLVGMVRGLVDCLRLSGGFTAYRSGNHELMIANHALDAAKAAEKKITQMQKRIAELEQLAETDELTGLLNRRGFNKQLQRTLSNATRYDEQGVLIYIDLDDFKPVNDAYGHAAGDEVLRQVAKLIRDSIRDTDYVGRLGGDEFSVLLTRTTWENGLSRAEIIEKQLNNTIVNWQGWMIDVAASIGLQVYGAKDDGQDLLSQADEDMYKTKRLRTYLSGSSPNVRRVAL